MDGSASSARFIRYNALADIPFLNVGTFFGLSRLRLLRVWTILELGNLMDFVMDSIEEEGKSAPSLDALAASRIGKRLREAYDRIVEEPVPDRFANLLSELEKQETKRSDAE